MAKAKGSQKTGGRRKGVPNKATADIKAACQKHGPALVKVLVALSKSEDERIVLGAVKELLDRGYGKSPQPMTGGDGEGPAIVRIEHVIIHPANPDG